MTPLKTKVWDLPLRVFHWLLVIAIAFQFITGDILKDAMQWHFYGGYTIIGLIFFRIIWGMLGTYYSRFTSFVVSPLTAFNYVKSSPKPVYLGHNPAGAYSVLFLLSVILAQAISGLFISDEIFTDGPYYGILSEPWQGIVDYVHHNIMNLIFIAVALHIAAIVYYKVKHKQALTQAMISGYKIIKNPAHASSRKPFPYIALFVSIMLTLGLLYLILAVWVPPPAEDYFGY